MYCRLGGGKSRRCAVLQIVAGRGYANAPRAFADCRAYVYWVQGKQKPVPILFGTARAEVGQASACHKMWLQPVECRP